MGTRKRFAGLVVSIALCLGFIGCTPNDRTVAVKATVAVAQSLAAVEAVNEDIEARGLIDAQTSTVISQDIIKATQVDDGLVATLKAASSNDATTRAAVLAALSQLVNVASDLQSKGVLGIKDPQSQQLFTVSVAAVQAGIATLQAIYQVASTPVLNPGSPHVADAQPYHANLLPAGCEITSMSFNYTHIRCDNSVAQLGRAAQLGNTWLHSN